MKKRILGLKKDKNIQPCIPPPITNEGILNNEEVIARLQKAMEMNIQKYGHHDPNKPMERKLIFYKGWPKDDK
ncbi:MAG: hypothetical protein IPK35_13345 [Saprospiraceae bacterium]|jgi:hypothetical protein|nr:hypothetical protein [Saprospiraceae bacterium]